MFYKQPITQISRSSMLYMQQVSSNNDDHKWTTTASTPAKRSQKQAASLIVNLDSIRLPSRRTIYTIGYTMSWHRTCTDITLLLKISPCHWNLLQYKNRVESLQQITQPTRETWLSCYEWNRLVLFRFAIISRTFAIWPCVYLQNFPQSFPSIVEY